MKKIVLMAVVMLASVTAFAQHRVGSITIQPKVGLNVADLTDSKGDSRIGLATGAEFEFQLTDIFSLTAGALYSMQGEDDAKLNYINAPILANVYVTRGLAVKLGLQPGFNVSDDDISGVKSVDLSIPVGLSYEVNRFVFDARYNFGVTKVADWADSKNSVFQFTVGYKFDLK